MTDGSFSTAARSAIYEATGGRCAGCGDSQVTAQHRIARGKGGTSRAAIGLPSNGVALCGSGTTGCHGWTEHHPTDAELLGWRVPSGTDPADAPFWTRYGWHRWVDVEGDWLVAYEDREDLDRLAEREAAVARYSARA